MLHVSFSSRPRTATAFARSRRCRRRAQFALAVALRSEDGAPLGDLFSFVSGLYFRGKLTYARRFAQPPDPSNPIVGGGIHVITPTAGLRSPDTLVTQSAVRAFARVDVDADNVALSPAARDQRPCAAGGDRARVRRRAARQRRVAEVRHRARHDLRRAAEVPDRVRRPRRHVARRAAAASRARRRRARLRPGRTARSSTAPGRRSCRRSDGRRAPEGLEAEARVAPVARSRAQPFDTGEGPRAQGSPADDSARRRERHAGHRRQGSPAHQPAQDLLARARADQGRPAPVLRRRRRRAAAARARPRDGDEALPERRVGRVLLHEARADAAAGVDRDLPDRSRQRATSSTFR